MIVVVMCLCLRIPSYYLLEAYKNIPHDSKTLFFAAKMMNLPCKLWLPSDKISEELQSKSKPLESETSSDKEPKT